ncbi:ABC transport system permease protein [Thiobacillus denitrificans ATCC 25259]|uniref:ABC transport system permease protein n=1 Tax=Thiobacillus denitrificans (strain ATCC 25259 / T1) TaxID=292415 RepID=Q3SM50_THIDA|nr:ABC transporter permease [Thiobacillus denitrificans]AAZ96200.1 ABC transport system permease protein [Thiobacillus denitrificans ATCC 25259]
MTEAHAHFDEAEGALVARGAWHADAAAALPDLSGKRVRVIDGAGVTHLDTNGAWLLLAAAQPKADAPAPDLRDFQPRHLSMLRLVAQHRAATPPLPAPRQEGVLALTGRGALTVWSHLVGLLDFVGRLALELAGLVGQPGLWRWRELAAQVRDVFVGAIPIVSGMMFLLGVVFAYLLGDQARQFGANIFVVDGLLLAVLREISPVIVAVLVAGRTGAAITAQLGTMKVAEEIDAIATLGLSPLAVLVIPRVLALIVAMPLLVFIGDIAGLVGGMLVVQQQLAISPPIFLDRLYDVILLKTLMVGLGKAPVFALFIALISCRMGLAVSRDARSVGVNTTSTVVQSLVAVIILNAVFAVAFVRLGI